MRNARLFASILVWLVLVACECPPPAPRCEPEPAVKDGMRAVADYPLLVALRKDTHFSGEFERYMKWVASLGVPDAVLVVGLMESDDKTLDSLATVFHEMVELKGWLDLGHPIENIMTVAYYQEHYPTVYPVAHRKGVLEEFSLIRYFATHEGFRDAPVLAYALVAPLVERHGTTPSRLVRRLKYNPEYLGVRVNAEDLELAVQVFERGGYRYTDRAKIIDGAKEYLATQERR